MFGDSGWDDTRTRVQWTRLSDWLASHACRKVIIECGAGTAVPTVRYFCEEQAASPLATLIRINPREPFVPAGHLSLPIGALEGLRALNRSLTQGFPSKCEI